jgi:hypothetical protein
MLCSDVSLLSPFIVFALQFSGTVFNILRTCEKLRTPPTSLTAEWCGLCGRRIARDVHDVRFAYDALATRKTKLQSQSQSQSQTETELKSSAAPTASAVPRVPLCYACDLVLSTGRSASEPAASAAPNPLWPAFLLNPPSAAQPTAGAGAAPRATAPLSVNSSTPESRRAAMAAAIADCVLPADE